MVEFYNKSINTAVFAGEFKETLYLRVIFDNISTCKDILSLKYKGVVKGLSQNIESFYNQITFVVKLEKKEKPSNIKLFTNGKFQITGVKNIDEARETISIISDKISLIECLFPIQLKAIKGFLVSENNDIFNEQEMIGDYRKGSFYLNNNNSNLRDLVINLREHFLKHSYDLDESFSNVYMLKKHENFSRKLFDCRGKHIGNLKYNFSLSFKHLLLYRCKFLRKKENIFSISNKNDKIIGECIIELFDKEIFQGYKEDVLIHRNYTYSNFKEINYSIKICNLNAMVSIDSFINREKTSNTLNFHYNIKSVFRQDAKYYAINAKLFFNEKDKLFVRKPDKFKNKVSLLIFRNGRILLCGLNSELQIDLIICFLKNFFDKHPEVLQKELQSLDSVIVKNENLSIHDFMK